MFNFNQCIMNFKLKTPKSQLSSLILSYVTLKDGKRFVYSTGQKIPVRLWDKGYQNPIRTKSQKDQVIINSVNLRLDRIKTEYLKLFTSFKDNIYSCHKPFFHLPALIRLFVLMIFYIYMIPHKLLCFENKFSLDE